MRDFYLNRVIILVCLAAAIFARSPCFDVFFLDDSLAYAHLWTSVIQGEESPATIFMAIAQGHAFPLWSIVFGAQTAVFGLNMLPWHLANAVYQALSGILLYHLLRRLLNAQAGAVTAAVLWSATVIGGYDEPAINIFEAHYTTSLGLLLAAMCLAMRTHGNPMVRLLITSFTALLAVLAWAVALLGLPMLAFKPFVHGDGTERPRSLWRASNLFPIAFGMLTIVVATALFLRRGSAEYDIPPAAEWPTHLIWLFAESLARLVWFGPSDPPGVVIGLGMCLLAMLAVFLGGRRSRRTAIVFFSYPFLVSMTIVASRPAFTLSSGDYLHLPAFFWCVVLGLVVDHFVRVPWPRWSRIQVAWAVGLSLLVLHQRLNAKDTVLQSTSVMNFAASEFEHTKELWLALSNRASHDRRVWRLPDIPVPLQLGFPYCFSVKTLAPLMPKDCVRNLEVIPATEWTAEDQRNLESDLDAIGSSHSLHWKQRTQILVPEIQSIAYVANQLKTRNQIVELPAYLVTYPELRLATDLNQLFILSRSRGKGLEILVTEVENLPRSLEAVRAVARANPQILAAWNRLEERALKNGRFMFDAFPAWRDFLGTTEWSLGMAEGCTARMKSGIADDVSVEILSLPSDAPWGITLMRGNFPVQEGETYVLEFRARANAPRRITMVLNKTSPPAGFAHPAIDVTLNQSWQSFEFPVVSQQSGNAAIVVNAGGSEIPFEIADLRVLHAGRRVDIDLDYRNTKQD